MKKEIIISVIVIILIVVLNIITQNHTNKTMDEILSKLDEIRIEITSNDNKDVNERIKNLLEIWKNRSESLAYYIEHDELEKVEQYIREVNSNIETEEYTMAIQSLDTCKFIINHIKDKYEFSFKNIF